jgi:predicted RNA-binding protein YlqC (UPF0109 family)
VTKQLVDNPTAIHVEEISGQHAVIYELHVGDGDMGKVIGKNGRTVNSLRTLLTAAAAQQGKRAVLEVMETNGNRPKSSQFKKPTAEPVPRDEVYHK